MKPGLMLGLVWLVWAVSWYGAAWWSGHTVGRPAPGSQIAYRAITSAGAILLFVPFRRHHDHWILWHLSAAAAWTAVGATAMGFLFAWWARIYLGRLWSGSITRKAQHRIVETGPYGIVRQPIYTGLILAVWASAVLKATILAFPGALAMTAGFVIKARLEERFLRQELGAEAYDSYRRQVPMLIPYGPKAARR